MPQERIDALVAAGQWTRLLQEKTAERRHLQGAFIKAMRELRECQAAVDAIQAKAVEIEAEMERASAAIKAAHDVEADVVEP